MVEKLKEKIKKCVSDAAQRNVDCPSHTHSFNIVLFLAFYGCYRCVCCALVGPRATTNRVHCLVLVRQNKSLSLLASAPFIIWGLNGNGIVISCFADSLNSEMNCHMSTSLVHFNVFSVSPFFIFLTYETPVTSNSFPFFIRD